MKEEKQETGYDSTVLPQEKQLLALSDGKAIMRHSLEGKRKPKLKRTESSLNGSSFIGQTICGVVDGSFDAGYLLTVRVGNTDMLLRGVVFEPGLSVPISGANDIAPNVKLTKRDENVLPEAQSTSNAIPVAMACTPVPMLPAPMPVPNAQVTSSLLIHVQAQPPVRIGSNQSDLVAPQPDVKAPKSVSGSQDNATDSSAYSKQELTSTPSEHVFHPRQSIETQMDLDEGA